jgi:signal transduction histidine kinase
MNIKPETLLHFIADTRAQLFEMTSANNLIDLFLDCVYALNVGRVRYYEAVRDSRSDTLTLVLRAMRGMNHSAQIHGLTIKESNATIFSSSDWQNPMHEVGAQAALDESKKLWVQALELENLEWYDFPIKYGGEKRGIVAVDRPLQNQPWDPLLLRAIAEVSHLFGHALEAISEKEQAHYLRRLSCILDEHSSIDTIPQEALDFIRDSLGAVSVTYFQLNPARLTLREQCASYVRPVISGPEEIVVGEHLTGAAWQNERYRLNINFPQLLAEDPCYECAALDKHRRLISELTNGSYSEIKTIIYSPVNIGQLPGIFRVINRVDDIRMPFTRRHKTMLDNIALALESRMSSVIHARMMDHMTTLADVLQRTPEKTDTILTSTLNILTTQGVSNIGLFLKSPTSDTCEHFIVSGDTFHTFELPNRIGWEADLFRCSSDSPTPGLVSISQTSGNGKLTRALRDVGAELIYVVPFRGNIAAPGAILFLLGTQQASPRADLDILSYWQAHNISLSLFETIGSLIGQAFEVANTSIRVSSSRRIFAAIGHEFRTPSQVIASQAVLLVNELEREYTRTEQIDKLTSLATTKQKVRARIVQMNEAITKAFEIGRQSTTVIQYDYRLTKMRSILADCETVLSNYADARRAILIIYDSAKNLRPVACDQQSIERVVYNLLDNALKYSNPRVPGKPMKIECRGHSTEKYIEISVINWGNGIAESDYENIFHGFFRTSQKDERRAVAGIGLGLAISRKIVHDHGGEIFVKSLPTLDDPIRNELMEGYETTFTVRLPADAAPGIKTVEA